MTSCMTFARVVRAEPFTPLVCKALISLKVAEFAKMSGRKLAMHHSQEHTRTVLSAMHITSTRVNA